MVDAVSEPVSRYPLDQNSRMEFWKRLHGFYSHLRQPDPQIPRVAGREIDLYILFNEVYTEGQIFWCPRYAVSSPDMVCGATRRAGGGR